MARRMENVQMCTVQSMPTAQCVQQWNACHYLIVMRSICTVHKHIQHSLRTHTIENWMISMDLSCCCIVSSICLHWHRDSTRSIHYGRVEKWNVLLKETPSKKRKKKKTTADHRNRASMRITSENEMKWQRATIIDWLIDPDWKVCLHLCMDQKLSNI